MARGLLVNRKSPVPLQAQLITALREAIVSGELRPGERILSSRELQTHLGVSRNTVTEALSQLHAEGYLVTVRGVGTFVSDAFGAYVKPREENAPPIDVPSGSSPYVAVRRLAENLPAVIPFRPGVPALDAFPWDTFRRSVTAALRSRALDLDYPDPQGYPRLREAIALRLRQTRGLACTPERIFITGGTQSAFSAISRILLGKGDVAIVEDPGYPNVRATLLAQNITLHPAGVDESGIQLDQFPGSGAKLVYVTPSHQYPLGGVLTLERRLALIEWAERHNAWIIEDDYDSEFHYGGKPQPALAALADAGRVIYVGTFSKSLAPALRIGYVVAPGALVPALRAYGAVTGGVPGMLIQAGLADFIENGHFARHINKMRRLYDDRRRHAVGVLEKHASITVSDSGAGLHLVAGLNDSVSDVDVSAQASASGMYVPALSSYYFAGKPKSGLLVGYAGTPKPQAAELLERLVKIAANASGMTV